MKHCIVSLLIVFTLGINPIYSQITQTQKNAIDLVKILVGNNPNIIITPGSEKIIGYPEQFGEFSGGTTNNFLIDKGIVLTSGTIDDADPNVAKYKTATNNGGPDYHSQLLANLVSTNLSNTKNTATLEFKFKAPSNKISFNYIFASVEYPSYVCSDYFDLFGFFISGPNPAPGAAYQDKNIALIPTTGKIVCINSINSGNKGDGDGGAVPTSNGRCSAIDPAWQSNSSLFVDNMPAPGDMYGNAKIMSNGYTKILTAKADILCNTEYTIKLIICDISDEIYDSYVYLEEGSFKTSGLSSEIRDGAGNVITGSNVSVTEGCNKTTLDLIVSPTPTSDFPITYSFKTTSTANTSGSSASGTYTTPDFKLSTSQLNNPDPDKKLIIPANTNKGTIIIEALKDWINDAGETVILSLPGTCGAANNDITITIRDRVGITATGTKPTCTTGNTTPNTDGKVENFAGSGGNPPYMYKFGIGGTYANAIIPNSKIDIPSTSAYIITVKDSYGCEKDTTIDLSQTCTGTTCVKPTINTQPSNARQCEGLNTNFVVAATGTSTTTLKYQWRVDKCTGTFVDTVGATNATLNLTSVKKSWDNYKYKCIVTETTNGGCKDSTNIVTLTVDGLPTAISTRDTTLCISEPAIVGGASFTNGTAKWTKSSNGGGILTNDTQKNPTYTPDASDAGKTIKLTMKVTKASGSTCTDPADVHYEIAYDSLPLAKILSDTTICYNLTAPVLDAKAKYGTISWATSTASGPVIGTITNSTTTSETFAPDIKDTSKIVVLTMTVTSNNACQLLTTPAKATATFDVTVVSPTTPIATAGGDTTICMSTAAKVSGAKAKNGTIQWVVTLGNGSLTNETTLTPTYQSTNNDTLLYSTTGVVLTMTVSPAGGCTGSPATAIYKIKVKSNPKVIPTATTVCLGADVSLDGNTSGGSYTWTGPNGYLKYTKPATIPAITKADSGLYQLMIKDAIGCKDSANVRVRIHPTPTIVGDTFACVGSSVTLSASNSIATSWISQIPANLTIDLATGVATAVKGGVTKVEFTDANGCKDEQLIVTEDLPEVDFVADSTSICIGNDVKFIDKSPIKHTNIVWDFGDGNQTNDLDPSYTYQKVDSFTVSLTSTSPNGCEGKLTKTKYITPIDVPTMKFAFSPDSIDIYNPEIQFINYSTAKFFTWNFGDFSPVSHEKNPLHAFPETPGIAYKVVLKGSNSLSGVCPISVYHEIVSIDPAIYFIPNSFTPNGDEINNTFQPIFTSGYDPQNYSFWIYNRLGQLVFESHNTAIGWDGTYGGKLAENNTYVWKLQFKSKQTEKEFYLTGHVNLVK